MIDINNPELPEAEDAMEVELPEDSMGDMQEDLIENEDGSVEIPLEDVNASLPQEFDGNLADVVDEKTLDDMATKLLELIEIDKKSREKRDKQYEDGIRRTGLGDDAPGGAGFEGASKVVHPVLAESCIDFAARAIKELFPANGPVRMETVGVLTPPEELEVKKLASCLNNQFTKKISEYRSVVEQKLTQLPLGGSQYTKFYPSKEKNRVVAEFVAVDNVFIPFYADSFYEAERVTHRQFLTDDEMELRITNEQYRDIALIKSATEPEQSASQTANDKIEGKTSSGENEDGTRTVYEVYTWKEIVDDQFSAGSRAPYIITIDELDEKILSIRRNWDQVDQTMQKLDWIVDDMFIPWRGAYGIGLPHLIGGLSGAATGALRALLDSAHINNAPTLLKLKGSKLSGQTKRIDVTEVVEIEGPVGVDDIRKYLMPMPFNAPSSVLFQLLGWLTDAAKGVVSTASEKIADATSNTPVGTTQALIEQGAIIFSSIHARLHFSQAKAFDVVLRILKQYFPEQLAEYEINPQTVSMKGVYPVSDPNIFSEAQRISQMQGALQLSKEAPELYNRPELHKTMLSLMKIQNAERFLIPPPPQAQPMDPAAEMIAFTSGAPVAVIPDQDHMSHILTHIAYLKNPMLGMNPVMIPTTGKVLGHLSEHLGQYFAARLKQFVQQAMQQIQRQQAQIEQTTRSNMMRLQFEAQQAIAQGANPQEVMASAQHGAQMINQQSQQMMPQMPTPEQLMAQASQKIAEEDAQFAQGVMEVITATDQFVREHMQMQDPNMVAVIESSKNQKLDIQRKAEKDAADAKLANERENNLRQLEAVQRIEEQRQNKFDQQMEQLKLMHQQALDKMQQQVELMKNDQDNRQNQLTELLKNHDDNKTSVIVEQIRQAMSTEQPQKLDDNKSYIADLQGLIKSVQEAQTDQKLGTIMEGLQATIAAARAPRKTTPMRDAEGNLVGAVSSIQE